MFRLVRGGAAALLGVAALLVFVAVILPTLFGWKAYTVTSGSMAPAFDSGAVVVVAPVLEEDLWRRDIVTFRDPDGYTTHRIVGVKVTSIAGERTRIFTTKGDANEDADPKPLDPRNVVGKAKFAVPHLGYFIELIKSPLGAGAFAALFLFVTFSGRAREKAPAEAVEDEQREVVEVS
jgi:signal peptidase